MNEKAVEVLVDAALRGVPQARGSFVSGEARCALGVLGEAMGLSMVSETFYPCALSAHYEMRFHRMRCPVCHKEQFAEDRLVAHLNDAHEWDFLTIARKLGPDATARAGWDATREEAR
jgi:hypothetical protein